MFAGKSNVVLDKYFPGMSEIKADPRFFNAVIDIPANGLHELQYCKPTNSTIYMMEYRTIYKVQNQRYDFSIEKCIGGSYSFRY